MSKIVDLQSSLGWRISMHAKIRAATRGVTPRQILECVAEPDLTYHSRGQQVRRRGPLAIVVEPSSRIVVTVLLAQEERWDDEDARRLLAGRG